MNPSNSISLCHIKLLLDQFHINVFFKIPIVELELIGNSRIKMCILTLFNMPTVD